MHSQFHMVNAIILMASAAAVLAEKACDPMSLAMYNMTFTGLWSKDVFPKQYPLFRPPAQWTKVIGMLIYFLY